MMGLKSKAKFWLRQFPFIYPRKFISSCAAWIDKQKSQRGSYYGQRGPWCKTIFAEGFLHHPAPQTSGTPNEKAFYNNRNYPTDKANLYFLQNCYVLGHKGLVLTADHQIFQEFSHHFGIASLIKFLLKNPFYTFTKSVKKMQGIGAVLISPNSHNYYHWLNDVLPRIKLYEQVLNQIDHFCIASNVPDKFLDILPGFGIPKSKILQVKDKEKVHFDYIYVSSLPGSEGRSPQWAVDYIRNVLVKTTKHLIPGKKIYFKRGANVERNILNEGALTVMLQNNGFEIIDPDNLSIYQQIELMELATFVISPHGAALSNLLFTNENIPVIEIFSPDYFRTDCFYTLAAIRKLNYWYVIGNKPSGGNWGDITVDEKLLLKTINQINARQL